jgi:hypothetical protein
VRGAAEARWCDPAFAVAAEVLCRRLILSRPVRAQIGLRTGESLRLDLRFEEAVAVRMGWSYLVSVLDRGGSRGERLESAIRRAAGRPATALDAVWIREEDPVGAAILRGTVYALLLEERLMIRYGRDWFRSTAARDLLRECWEAEPGESAESMARALDLGTIEPTPIIEGCRP